jgi:hypothetical protein
MTAYGKKPMLSASSARSGSRRRAPDVCPQCGSGRLVAIAYGYPGPEMMAAAERGEVLLGGCVVSEEMPLDGCADCNWPRSESRAVIGEDLVAVPDPGSDWWVICEFALTFDGYDHGSDAAGRIGNRLRAEFADGARLPADVDLLRRGLFFEQRRFHHFGDSPAGEDDTYVRRLVGEIGRLSGGHVIDQHPVV